jgi:hypothetical protein
MFIQIPSIDSLRAKTSSRSISPLIQKLRVGPQETKTNRKSKTTALDSPTFIILW